MAAAVQAEIVTVKAKVQKVNAEIEVLEKGASDPRLLYLYQLPGLHQQLAGLHQQLAGLHQQLAGLHQQLAGLQLQLTALQGASASVAGASAEASAGSSTLPSLSDTIKALRREVPHLTPEKQGSPRAWGRLSTSLGYSQVPLPEPCSSASTSLGYSQVPLPEPCRSASSDSDEPTMQALGKAHVCFYEAPLGWPIYSDDTTRPLYLGELIDQVNIDLNEYRVLTVKEVRSRLLAYVNNEHPHLEMVAMLSAQQDGHRRLLRDEDIIFNNKVVQELNKVQPPKQPHGASSSRLDLPVELWRHIAYRHGLSATEMHVVNQATGYSTFEISAHDFIFLACVVSKGISVESSSEGRG